MKPLAPVIAFLWAGVAIGATLIATPVKFLAPSLALTTALEIGRVTFFWVGIAELVLCLIFIISVIAFGGISWRISLVPIIFFAIQRLGMMPILDARALEIIAGNSVEESNLHTIYIYVEFAKVFALLLVGTIGIFFAGRDNHDEEDHEEGVQISAKTTVTADHREGHSYAAAPRHVTLVEGTWQIL
ncbi:MAG: hypothetical protein JKY82_12870 [Rhizobiaceae bacterium]|nr:hypothetical protein [Rhizobiaceae bacterium]